MSGKIKLWAYVVLVILAIWFGLAFHYNYSAISRQAAMSATNDSGDVSSPVNRPVTTTNVTAASSAQTNVSNPGTNAVASTNEAAATNGIADTNPPAGAGANSNLVEQATNSTAPPATPAAASNAVVPPPVPPPVPTAGLPAPIGRSGRTIGYLVALVGVLIGLGVLIAHDVTQFMGSHAIDFLLSDRGEGARDPEYDSAEQVWANGEFLEAIQMMRDYLKKNPREQHVALRIAEIYEKDLRNFLAAVLEYEEVLKNKLPAERWGWAAIHLCNLYSKMGQSAKAMALLERIADEYPRTAAAKKARARLGRPEPEEEPVEQEVEEESSSQPSEDGSQTTPYEVVDPGDDPVLEEEPPEEEEPPPPPPEPKSNLPPGFRPKK